MKVKQALQTHLSEEDWLELVHTSICEKKCRIRERHHLTG